MKNLNPFTVVNLQRNELITIAAGDSVDPDALREYIEDRYGKVLGLS